jgi:hypothetical protein
MPIRYEHEEIIKLSPSVVFEAIDNLPLTAQWLPPCVSLTKMGDGPNEVGDKLLYVYRQGGRQAEMVGEIVARRPGQQLHCKYIDPMFDVSVDLRLSSCPGGTLSQHIIEIIPKTLLGKLMSPLIRMGIKKQTRDAATNLRKLLESTDSTR